MNAKKEKRTRRFANQRFARCHRGAENPQPREVTKREERKHKIIISIKFNRIQLNLKFYFISLLCFMNIANHHTAAAYGPKQTAQCQPVARGSVASRVDFAKLEKIKLKDLRNHFGKHLVAVENSNVGCKRNLERGHPLKLERYRED